MKTCPRCSTTHDKKHCPACAKQYAAARYQQNRDKILSQVHAWRDTNPEKVRQMNQAYRATHKAEMRAQDKAWYQRNKEHVRTRAKAWRTANRDKYVSAVLEWQRRHPEYQRLRTAKRRARVQGGTLSHGILKRLYEKQKGLCPCCGKSLGVDFHLDHITPLSKGGAHADWNMQLLRPECNIEKSNQDPESFMWKRGFDGYVAPTEPL